MVDGCGLPVRFALTTGEAHDSRLAAKLLSRLKSGSMLLADRDYDADCPSRASGVDSWTLRSPHQTQELPGLAPGCSESYKTSQSGGRSRELFRERPTLQRIKTSSGAGLINTAPNSTPGLTEIATIHSTVYSPRMSVGDGLRSIDINCNTA